MPRERIYTKAGDDGSTGLFYGGRVPKDSELPTAYGTVDEAQAVLGLARAQAGAGSPIDSLLVPIMRDLYVLMAELATLPENRGKLQPGMSSVTEAMVDALERTIDDLDEQFEHPTEFVVPGVGRHGRHHRALGRWRARKPFGALGRRRRSQTPSDHHAACPRAQLGGATTSIVHSTSPRSCRHHSPEQTS